MTPEKIKIKGIEKYADETNKIDINKNKITTKIDGIEAVKQAVFLMLATEENYSEIYKEYGIKTVDLIGRDFNYVISELKRRIEECLIKDERIKEVNNFEFYNNSDELLLKFNVITIYGDFETEGVFKS